MDGYDRQDSPGPDRAPRLRDDAARDRHEAGTSASGLLGLQVAAGNKAVNQLLRQASPSPPVPAHDPAAEGDADRVADSALARMRGVPPAAGASAWPSRIPASLAEAVAPELGDVAGVEVRSGREASRTADDIGALAYAEPGAVTVGSRAPSPASRQGAHLLAHEATHAVRHRGGLAAGGGRLVHAKLAGTSDALLAHGGAKTSGVARKAVGKRTQWDKVISRMRRYEAAEARATAMTANGKATLPTPVRDSMVRQLQKVEAACLAWREANDEAGAQAMAEAWHKETTKGKTRAFQATDDRTKAPRRQAIALLLPRVRSELAGLQSGAWEKGMTLTDTTRTGTGATNQGAMNKVVEQHYGTEQGAFSGYFKEEKGFDPTPAGHDVETGIRQADPNYGARAVAMTRIDQLLGTSLMVRTEFATSGGKLGTVGESAKGTRAVDTKFVLTDAERATNPGAISLQDAVLQKALNQMQIIDAICGQLDRHAGNWFVQADAQGRVTGVSGMDLDMAFGKDLKDPDGRQARKAMHYRGMPQLVDADLAKRILLLEDDDIRTAVDGLLEQGEVEALVARFTVVKSKIAQIAKSGGLVKVWDAATAAKARPENTRDMRDIDKKSYQHNLTFDAMEKIKKNVQAALNVNRKTDIGAYFEAPAQAYLTELGPPADAGVFNGAVQVVMAVFYERLVTGKIDPAKAMETAWKMMGALLGDLAKDPARKKRVRDEFAKTKSFGYASAAADILKEVTIVLYQSDFGATMPALPATPTPPVTAKA